MGLSVDAAVREALARIREVVDQRAKAERRAAFEKELRDAARVAVRLEVPRAAVSIPDSEGRSPRRRRCMATTSSWSAS